MTSNAVKSRFMGWPMKEPIMISAGAIRRATSKLDPMANEMGRSIWFFKAPFTAGTYSEKPPMIGIMMIPVNNALSQVVLLRALKNEQSFLIDK
jgi:hypothetical protein